MKKHEPMVPERDSKPQYELVSDFDRNPVPAKNERVGLETPPAPASEPVQEGQRLEIVVRVTPSADESGPPTAKVEVVAEPGAVTGVASAVAQAASERRDPEPQRIPARMMNEFVYCRRLFYYEFVEGVFIESADTLRGDAIHQRVDSGSGALPAARKKAKTEEKPASGKSGDTDSGSAQPSAPSVEGEAETIHSRSVQMGSERLGIVAKMDLVEVRAAAAPGIAPPEDAAGDLFTALEVCPVDYKAGAPKEGEEANELWDTDKMQLGLQALILRDNGYTCNEGVIYYRATKQRVRLPITAELEAWIIENIADAKRVIAGPIPAPLVHSPKCVRCSLAPVCLPDETRMLAQASVEG